MRKLPPRPRGWLSQEVALLPRSHATSAALLRSRRCFSTWRAFGGVDILVNNAGVIRNGTVVEMNEADWDLMFDVNIKGMFLTCKNAIPQMRERGGGAIVNVA